MSRSVNLVVLCEDRQHEAFIRRFLQRRGHAARSLRVRIAPPGRGSAEQFVRRQYPEEVRFYRTRRHRVGQALLVMVDADGQDRRRQLAETLAAGDVPDRTGDERIAVFTPARSIETWLAYLDGRDVNEIDQYPRLARQRDCQRHAEALDEMCDANALRQPCPDSLEAACDEFNRRLRL